MRIKPKKSLGQNFLVDKNIRLKIIEACGFSKEDIVLEIGPGSGEMTQEIAPKVKRVLAVEIDKNLCDALRRRFALGKNVTIVNGDILKTDLSPYFKRHIHRVKVFGNIPYYITTPILGRIFKYRKHIKTVFLTVQKEFAARLAAPAGSRVYGSLSCFVRYYSEPKVLFTVKNACFYPKPKVDSSFLRLELKEKLPAGRKEEACFFAVVRAAFGQRRKKIKNSLTRLLEKEEIETILKECGIQADTRAESLDLADYLAIASSIKKSKKILTKP